MTVIPQRCKFCREFESDMVADDGEPLMEMAYCGACRKYMEADDACNAFATSLWALAKIREAEDERA